MRLDAQDLPSAEDFFDAVIAIDCFLYYGADDRSLSSLVPLIRSGGFLGIVDIAFAREIESIDDAPDYLRGQYAENWTHVHSIDWWRRHWEKPALVNVECAEPLPESRALLRDYVAGRGRRGPIMQAAPHDRDGLLTLFRFVARKR